MRLNDQECQELIAAAEDRRAAATDPKARGHLTSAVRKLKQLTESRQQPKDAAWRRGSIRTGKGHQ
jgi:hypothetical protein